MCVFIYLPALKPKVFRTRSHCSVKATGAMMNLDNVGVRDIISDVVVISGKMDIMLYLSALYLI